MKLLLFEDVRRWVIKESGFIKLPSFDKSSNMYRLISHISGTHSAVICDWLDTLNNQGIEFVDCSSFYCTRKGSNRIPLNYMSSGEKFYLVAIAAEITQTPVYLWRGLEQLSKNSLRRLLIDKRDSKYVNILCTDAVELSAYKDIQEGRLWSRL